MIKETRRLCVAAATLLAMTFCGVFATIRAGASPASRRDDREVRSETPSSERLLQAAVLNLEKLRALSAEFEFEARFFGERFSGRGRYEELTTRSSLDASPATSALESNRFLLHAELAPSNFSGDVNARGEANLIDAVCDADRRTWWRFSSIEGTKTLRQLSIEDLEGAIRQLDDEEVRNLVENGVDRACGMSGLPGLGGLSGVLKKLKSSYRFEPESTRVSAEEGGVEFFKIVGTAKERFFRQAKSNFGEAELSSDLLKHLPTTVEIYFSVDVTFPCKIAYYSDANDKTKTPIFSVSYTSITRNDANVSPENFNYVQPQINSERVDSEYLQELISSP